MKTLNFFHGGRHGDLIYAMYTVYRLCMIQSAEATIKIAPYHTGFTVDHIESIKPLLLAQDYVKDVQTIELPPVFFKRPLGPEEGIDVDLHAPERVCNPQDFPEWDKKVWPGNINQAKRVAIYHGLNFDEKLYPSQSWIHLTKPSFRIKRRIVVHYLARRAVRSLSRMNWILNQLRYSGHDIVIVGLPHELEPFDKHFKKQTPKNFLHLAQTIKSADAMICCGSSPYALSRAMNQTFNFFDITEECNNNKPLGCRDTDITTMDDETVVECIRYMLDD